MGWPGLTASCDLSANRCLSRQQDVIEAAEAIKMMTVVCVPLSHRHCKNLINQQGSASQPARLLRLHPDTCWPDLIISVSVLSKTREQHQYEKSKVQSEEVTRAHICRKARSFNSAIKQAGLQIGERRRLYISSSGGPYLSFFVPFNCKHLEWAPVVTGSNINMDKLTANLSHLVWGKSFLSSVSMFYKSPQAITVMMSNSKHACLKIGLLLQSETINFTSPGSFKSVTMAMEMKDSHLCDFILDMDPINHKTGQQMAWEK